MLILLLLGCSIAQSGVTRQTLLMEDPMPGSAPGEFYVLVNNQTCTDALAPLTGAVMSANCVVTSRLLRCQETAKGEGWKTDCHIALTSDEAFLRAQQSRVELAVDAPSGPRCAEVLNLIAAGFSEAAVIEKVRAMQLSVDEGVCITSADTVPRAVKAAVALQIQGR